MNGVLEPFFPFHFYVFAHEEVSWNLLFPKKLQSLSGMPSIASSKVTMTTILSQRKAGPWKRDIEKTKGTDSIGRSEIHQGTGASFEF